MTYQLDFSTFPELVSQTHESGVDEGHVKFLDKALHDQWGLGRNLILVWVPHDNAIELLVIPHYALSEYANRIDRDSADPTDFMDGLYTYERRSESVIEGVYPAQNMSMPMNWHI